MLNTNPRMRPSADDLVKNPVVKEKMGIYGYLDVDDNNNHLESLINTIIVPRNLKNLDKELPKEKKYVI